MAIDYNTVEKGSTGKNTQDDSTNLSLISPMYFVALH